MQFYYFPVVHGIREISDTKLSGERMRCTERATDLKKLNIDVIEVSREGSGRVVIIGAVGGGKAPTEALLSHIYDPIDEKSLLNGQLLRKCDIQRDRERFVELVL